MALKPRAGVAVVDAMCAVQVAGVRRYLLRARDMGCNLTLVVVAEWVARLAVGASFAPGEGRSRTCVVLGIA